MRREERGKEGGDERREGKEGNGERREERKGGGERRERKGMEMVRENMEFL